MEYEAYAGFGVLFSPVLVFLFAVILSKIRHICSNKTKLDKEKYSKPSVYFCRYLQRIQETQRILDKWSAPLTWLAYNLALFTGFALIYMIFRRGTGQNNECSQKHAPRGYFKILYCTVSYGNLRSPLSS